ncbi:hypothetical protein WL502_11975 [Staphylococcus lugdunensis]|nr:hypothetical protein HMPREF0790_1050 [Staphylococcus lugdunensis M23590]
MQQTFLRATQAGVGPQHREMQQTFLRATQAGVGPSAQRNAPSISTDNASWGGPIIMNFLKRLNR